jgi:Leucine-rich repeat (LRR) protein
MQQLTYYILSNTCVLKPDTNASSLVILTNTSASITAESYESSGSIYTSTVGDLRIDLISGSIVIGTLSYDQTNFFIDSASLTYATSSVNNIGIQYSTTLDYVSPNSSYYFKIIDSASLVERVKAGITPGTSTLTLPANSSSMYNVELYSGDNKINSIYFYDATSSLIHSSSWIGTSSYGITIEPTSSLFYYINAFVDSYCCIPILTSISNNNFNSLQLYYQTGSCSTNSTCSYILAEQSIDQISWSYFATGSCMSSSLISDVGTYPTQSTYYRLKTVCSGSYSSDQSNTLLYTPSVYPAYIELTYDSIGHIPVSPTNSLYDWNSYLGTAASFVVVTGSTVRLLGENLVNTFRINTPSQYLTKYTSDGLTNLTSCSLYGDGLLTNFPIITNSPYITYVDIDANLITGSILNFTSSQYLQSFIARSNRISGSVQDIFTVLPSSSISIIDVGLNKITGSIPILTASANLQYFDIHSNILTGSIADLNGNNNLQYFNVSNNKLTNFPSLENCSNLSIFNCYNNIIIGNIPILSSSYLLTKFDCGQNGISGSIPNLNNNYLLEEFYCNSNKLSGSIPNLSYNPYLRIFNCSNNKISGSIPNLSLTPSLVTFNCAINKLSGSILGFNYCPNLQYFYCGYNALQGVIPSLDNCPSITYANFTSNKFSGSIPNIPSSLVTFAATDNYLTGSTPDLSSSINLYNFNVTNNQLSGSIGNVSGAVDLYLFYVSNNNLQGAIPALYHCPSLTQINFGFNKLDSYISASGTGYTLPTSLTYFAAYDNVLTQTAVDGILGDLDNAGGIGGNVQLGGTGNSSPSTLGLSYTASLVSKGWTVVVN